MPTANTWHHIAYVRINNVTKLYVDGVEVISVSDAKNYASTHIMIGGFYSSSQVMDGKVSDVRYVVGTAVYTGDFTPPSGALTLTGDIHMHDVFGPMMKKMPKVSAPLTYRLPHGHTKESFARNCALELEDCIKREDPKTVLAFIFEPIGGLATGAVVSDNFYMKEVRRICNEYGVILIHDCLLYTSPSPRDRTRSRMPSSA